MTFLERAPLPAGVRAHLASPLYRNAYMLILSSGGTSVLGFVFWVLAAREYPTAVVGVNSAAISAMMLVSGVAQLGLNAVLVRYLPRAGTATTRLVTRSYVVSGVLTALLAFAAAVTSAHWSPRLEFLGSDAWWIAGFTIGAASWTIFALQDAVMTGLRSAHWIPVENAVYAVGKIVLLVALVGVMPLGGTFAAWNIPTIVICIGTNLFIYLFLIPRRQAHAPEEPIDVNQLLRFASGNYVGSLFTTAATLLLPLLVTAELGARDTAYFFIPWTIMSSVNLVAMSMSTSMMVEVAIDESRLRDDVRRIIRQTARLVVPVVALVIVVAPYVLRVLGEPYAREGTTLLRLLALATLPKIISEVGLAVTRIRRAGRATVTVQAAQAVPMLVLSFVLISRFGINGVGVAWLITQVGVALWLLLGMLRPVLSRRPNTMGPSSTS